MSDARNNIYGQIWLRSRKVRWYIILFIIVLQIGCFIRVLCAVDHILAANLVIRLS